MATQIRLRRGTTAQNNAFTGVVGEVTVDTTKNTLVVHNGVTAGGIPLATNSALTTHTGLATGAHAATAISNAPAGNLAATTVQAAINELDIEKAGLATANAFTNTNSITANSASPALTITQTGTGHAFVVEDSTSPDATPFVIKTDGRVAMNTLNAIGLPSVDALFEVNEGTGRAITIGRSSANAFGANLNIAKSRALTYGDRAAVISGDALGGMTLWADDGTTLIQAAAITALVDGTPATGSMPVRLAFYTTPDGTAALIERMRLDNLGRLGLGGTAGAGQNLFIRRPVDASESADAISVLVQNQFSGTLTSVTNVQSQIRLDPSATVSGIAAGYRAAGLTRGAGATVATLVGFEASEGLTGATNNYGFYGNIPSGTGRWNTYHAGSAPNYFAGDVRTNTVVTQATSPVNSNVSATLAASTLLGGIATGTPAAGINFTVPTGTNTDAAFQELQTNQMFEWSVINLAAATHAITLLANTAHTLVGNAIVAANTSGRFGTRKTAANTFITYRLG